MTLTPPCLTVGKTHSFVFLIWLLPTCLTPSEPNKFILGLIRPRDMVPVICFSSEKLVLVWGLFLRIVLEVTAMQTNVMQYVMYDLRPDRLPSPPRPQPLHACSTHVYFPKSTSKTDTELRPKWLCFELFWGDSKFTLIYTWHLILFEVSYHQSYLI